MPRNLTRHAFCAGPDEARPHTRIGGFVGLFISIYYANAGLLVLGALGLLTAVIVQFGWGAICWLAPLIIWAAAEFRHWYYHERLLCLREPECAIGTVASEPTIATDGDSKLNLLLAPHDRLAFEESLIQHLDRNRAMLQDPANFPPNFTPPAVPTLNELTNDPAKLPDYVDDLRPAENMWNQVTIGVIDTLMLNPARNFFNRFYRKDAAHITDPATWNYIPVDFAAPDPPAGTWQDPNAQSTQSFPNPVDGGSVKLNPMFRWDDDTRLPYMHTEIDGYWINVLVDDVIFLMGSFWILCLAFGPLIGIAIALALWLLKKLFDWLIGNDGDADEPDVDWDDPDFPGPDGVTGRPGDVVAVFGPWIMDTEHGIYFEIHPVQAYYLLALNEAGEPELVEENTGPNFDPTQVSDKDAIVMCEAITRAEQEDSPPTIEREGAALLSYGMTTRYGGGGANVPAM